MSNFIISFDCEGKWGLADCLTQWHQNFLTNERLIQTYRKILDLLDKYEIPATFAFVGGFTFSIEQYHAYSDKFLPQSDYHQIWLNRFHQDIKMKKFDGWFVPECFLSVKQKRQHEIASHGFTHVPLYEKKISAELFDHEIHSVHNLVDYENELPETFVFPRNDVGYIDRLSKFGFIGYRENANEKRINRLVREFNIFDKTENSSLDRSSIIHKIPAGHFLNLRQGLRARVPLSVSRLRWRSLIRDAVNSQKTLHLWSHPHNFIGGSDMYTLFELILKEVSLSIKAREIKPITQRDYCKITK